VYPLEYLRQEGHNVSGYFYNPNIHPYREFKRRIAALVEFAEIKNFQVEINRNYGLKEYLRKVVFKEDSRCGICYAMRLEQTAKYAAEQGADAFTSTLLYSKYQNHELLINTARKYGERYKVEFFYQDFRKGWQEGIDGSIAMELYRQPYCGCIYSEQERYDKKLRKKMRQQAKNA
jgi:predicted adenine nucleotide alpha hydrolase (AANH) superfamily ATPase